MRDYFTAITFVNRIKSTLRLLTHFSASTKLLSSPKVVQLAVLLQLFH